MQMESAGGVLVTEGFGRQRQGPQELMNRLIVPLEKRTPDGLKAHSVSITTPAEAAAEAEVKSKLNISDEDWEKHNS